jgi:hypothetical protein
MSVSWDKTLILDQVRHFLLANATARRQRAREKSSHSAAVAEMSYATMRFQAYNVRKKHPGKVRPSWALEFP